MFEYRLHVGGTQSTSHMNNLPEDILWYIWKIYNTHNVLDELMSRTGFTWYKPSRRLMSLVSCDLGALQHNHTDLDQMIEDHNMWVYHECVQSRCMDCAEYGFPCHYLAERGFEKPHLAHMWQANF